MRWRLPGHFIAAITSCLGIYLYDRHLPATGVVAALNLLWLLADVLYIVLLDIDGFVGFFVVYAMLFILAIFYKEGFSNRFQ